MRQNAALCGNGLKDLPYQKGGVKGSKTTDDTLTPAKALISHGRHAFGSPRSILRIKARMYADGLLPEATTTTPIAT